MRISDWSSDVCSSDLDGHGTAPACVGLIPNSHLVFGGDEWWFHGPRIFAGDRITNERIPLDYVVKETKFAGPTCFQRGDTCYFNDRGDKIANQRPTSIRYPAENRKSARGGKGWGGREDCGEW